MPQRLFFREKNILNKSLKRKPKTNQKARLFSFLRRDKKMINIIFKASILGGVFCILVVVGIFAWYSKDLPDPSGLHEKTIAASTKIYDRTGSVLLYEIHGEEKRTLVKLDQISPYVKWATIAIEDKSFYEHRGINFRGVARAFLFDIRGRGLQGGSSITQQLVKNSILSPERTISRKIKEAILALEMERRFTKDQILEMYLNQIPYGSNAFGIEAASQTYFNTSARDLSLAQAALLAALPKAPTYYSPYGSHVDELKWRQEAVLDRMAQDKYITKDEAEAAKKIKLVFAEKKENIVAPHFVFYIKEQLVEKYGEKVVEQGGLKVITTLDIAKQRAGEAAVTKYAEQNKKYGARNAALVSVDPKSGQILAMVGSVDYFDKENDGNVNVAIRHRSPGSSFKPFVYATAFKKGYTPNTILIDALTKFSSDYEPKNYDLRERGPVSMKAALAMSLNIPAVKTLYLAGLNETLQTAKEMGFTTLNDPERYGLSLVLGGGEVKLLEETAAYGVFAAEGARYPITSILKVEDIKGKTLEDNTKNRGEKVLDKQIARQINDILSDNNARAGVFGIRNFLTLPDRPVAAKTGTTQEFRDGWTIGYTPSLVAGVWVGNNDNSPMKKEPGAVVAAPIWHDFMAEVLKGTPVEQFTKPNPPQTDKAILNGKVPGETKVKVKKINDHYCLSDDGEEITFIKLHSILYYVEKNNPQGPSPENPELDPQFANWEAGVNSWMERQKGKSKDTKKVFADPPQDKCGQESTDGISFSSPSGYLIKKSPLKIAVHIDNPEEVSRVEFFVADNLIGEKTEGPYEASYSFSEKEKGNKTIKAKVYKENGETQEISKTVVFNTDDNPPSLQLIAPGGNTALSSKDFPYLLKAKVEDESGISHVDFFFSKKEEAGETHIAKSTSPHPDFPGRYEVWWNNKPKTGDYILIVKAFDKSGNKTTKTVSLTIK